MKEIKESVDLKKKFKQNWKQTKILSHTSVKYKFSLGFDLKNSNRF